MGRVAGGWLGILEKANEADIPHKFYFASAMLAGHSDELPEERTVSVAPGDAAPVDEKMPKFVPEESASSPDE